MSVLITGMFLPWRVFVVVRASGRLVRGSYDRRRTMKKYFVLWLGFVVLPAMAQDLRLWPLFYHKAGANSLRILLRDDTLSFGFYARCTDAAGTPIVFAELYPAVAGE